METLYVIDKDKERVIVFTYITIYIMSERHGEPNDMSLRIYVLSYILKEQLLIRAAFS